MSRDYFFSQVSDFDGAMENWGLIIGSSSLLLLDPEHADLKTKTWVATVQSHEIAHMWFGNITTMKWWDNLYLNEGFATLVREFPSLCSRRRRC